VRTYKTPEKGVEEPVVLDFYRGEEITPHDALKARHNHHLHEENSKMVSVTSNRTLLNLQQLRQAILAQQQILEQLGELVLELSKGNRRAVEHLEELLRGFEPDATLDEESEERSEYSDPGEELLSIPEVRKRLGMGKSWVYQRLKSGEIPNVRLGNNFKVRRQDLEEYIRKNRRNQATG
jgi:excisionase family DNA binding protein